MITFQKYQNFEEAEPIQSEWDRFVEAQTADIFLSFDWCRIWWKYYGRKREPLLFVFRNDGQICGILPMFREKIRLGPFSARVVKPMCTDYSPVTVSIAVRTENLEEVIPLLLEGLQKLSPWDILFFGALCGRYPDTDLLVGILKNHLGEKYCIESPQRDVQTYFRIEPDWEKQLLLMHHDCRHSTRRVYKTLLNNDLDLNSRLASQETLRKMFDEMAVAHRAQWNEKGMPGHFIEWPMAHQYHRELAETQAKYDRLRLIEIRLNQTTIGYEFLYRFGDTYLNYSGARIHFKDERKIHFHRVAFGEMCRLANKENIRWIDSMRGSYDFKKQFGGQLLPIKNVIVSSSKEGHALKMKLFLLSVWLLNIGYSKIWRRRVMPKFGIKNRRFLDLWVRTHFLAE
jgi:CelD/BcsL family acetyltransferase involved in cellulose biosynthesis